MTPWNGKLGKKNNWYSADVTEWSYMNCMKQAEFLAELGDGKVARIFVPRDTIRLIAAVMEHRYGIKPMSKQSLMRKKKK